MRIQIHASRFFVFLVLLVCLSGISSFAQDGKLIIHVSPKQAYIFLDGHAVSEASKHHSLRLSAGDHKIELANYGYSPSTQTVTIAAGKTSKIDVTLSPVAGTVSGPFGAMTIERAEPGCGAAEREDARLLRRTRRRIQSRLVVEARARGSTRHLPGFGLVR